MNKSTPKTPKLKLDKKGLWTRIQAYLAVTILATFALHDFYVQSQHKSKNYIIFAGMLSVLLLVEKVVRTVK